MEVTLGALRNDAAPVLDLVASGQSLSVSRHGTPVAELRPLRRPALDARALLERWRHLPAMDPERLRADVDAVLDPPRPCTP